MQKLRKCPQLGCKRGETIRDRKDAVEKYFRTAGRRGSRVSICVRTLQSARSADTLFFIIFTVVAETSAYLPERAVAIKHRPAAQIRLLSSVV